jgi:hypothetical protein
MIYDIFYITDKEDVFAKFKDRFPTAQRISKDEKIENIKKKSFTKMFWLVWEDQIVNDKFSFEYRSESWDEEYTHIFRNGDHFDGVWLVPKRFNLSNKEFHHRFVVEGKKEIDMISCFAAPYDKFEVSSVEDFMSAKEQASTSMYWVVWKDLELTHALEHHVPRYDQNLPHVFKNGEYFDGVWLMPKDLEISSKEIENRFIVGDKKEINVVYSNPRKYDVFFISYKEPYADDNFSLLSQKCPSAIRIEGIQGIHNAHKKAAELSTTPLFWIVDADAEIVDDFNFEIAQGPYYDFVKRKNLESTVHVWHSRNPINDLEYGYGGVKLLPKDLTLEMDFQSVDMTTSISERFVVVPQVSNITKFNTDPFSTWRSAFRECVKLSSTIIDRSWRKETEDRLKIWCEAGEDRDFGSHAIAGARAGREYGYKYVGKKEFLSKINDFEWLRAQFESIDDGTE